MTEAATNIPRTCYTEVSPVVTLDFIESYSKNDFVPLEWIPFHNRSIKCSSSTITYSRKYVKRKIFFLWWGDRLCSENESFLFWNSATPVNIQPPTSVLPSLFCRLVRFLQLQVTSFPLLDSTTQPHSQHNS